MIGTQEVAKELKAALTQLNYLVDCFSRGEYSRYITNPTHLALSHIRKARRLLTAAEGEKKTEKEEDQK